MKRCVLFAMMALILSGCGPKKVGSSNTVSFYYLEKEFNFERHESILSPEIRVVSEHRDNLNYLLALYLVGPAEESHLSPLPSGTRIYCRDSSVDAITLELSEASHTLSETDFTLACACLALTCFDITGVQEVTVVSGDRHITMNTDSLLLADVPPTFETEETK